MKAIVLIAGLVLSTSAIADRTKEFAACMDNIDYGAFKNSRMTACLSEEMDRQQKVLEKEFLNVYTYSNRKEQSELTEGQRNFLIKREKHCRAEEAKDEAPSGQVNYGFCILEYTDKWINVIRSLEPEGPPAKKKPNAGKKSLAIPIQSSLT
jgi:uncharacterized protein YecT (DUF1311 family)